jgi:hypothetical protein
LAPFANGNSCARPRFRAAIKSITGAGVATARGFRQLLNLGLDGVRKNEVTGSNSYSKMFAGLNVGCRQLSRLLAVQLEHPNRHFSPGSPLPRTVPTSVWEFETRWQAEFTPEGA